MTEAETKPEQQTLRMTEYQCNYVALAQRVHNQMMAEANAKAQEAQTTLRQAVEGAFLGAGQTVPTAEVRIVNDERGRPAVLVWSDPEKAEEAAATEEMSSEALPEEKPVEEKPKAQAVNGKTSPEAVKRKLPVK